MLLQANATVTICHSRTQNLPEFVKQADIIVGAVGKAELIQKDWIKQVRRDTPWAAPGGFLAGAAGLANNHSIELKQSGTVASAN